MGSYRAIPALMSAVEEVLKRDFPGELAGASINGRVQWIGSADFRRTDFGSLLGIYLYRVSVDATPGSRLRPAEPGGGEPPGLELPLDLHFLLIAWASSAQAESELHAYGMQQLASYPVLDLSDFVVVDPDGHPHDQVQILPEEVATEDLHRIWDSLPADYSLTSTYVMRTARIAIEPSPPYGRVKT